MADLRDDQINAIVREVAELRETNTRLSGEVERLKRSRLRWRSVAYDKNAALVAALRLNTPLLGVVTAARLFVETQERLNAATHPCDRQALDALADHLYGSLAAAVRAAFPSESQPAPAPGVDVTAADNVSFRQPGGPKHNPQGLCPCNACQVKP
jgi:hypothetical protein